ncbi:hypothetical protein [Streptomyces benahoarensis]|uniref:hypothetical protein n=1 Tax=Streptomyces benahoarensis TaxID=2595054 RepID=UPI00203657B5|nr:hypothetical protein [Streptomyces benahoarensis]
MSTARIPCGCGGRSRAPASSPDALRRVGTVRLTGTSALVPLHRAGDARIELAEVADWFALARPPRPR